MKKLNCIFLPSLVFIVQYSFSQPGFNLIKDLGLPTNHFRAMLVDNDTIVGYGLAYNDTTNGQQGLLLTKFDSSGNFIKSNLILDSLGDHLSIAKHWGKITQNIDGGYAMTAATFFRNSAVLIKVNNELEVEFIKEYEDTVNLSNYFYKLVEIPDGYLLYGAIQRPNFLNDAFIRRVDKQGNTVWFQYYGDYNTDNVFLSSAKINDTLFVFGGVSGDNVDNAVTVIQFIDWHGNIVKTWNSEPEPEIGYLRAILTTEDKGILTFGLYVVDVIDNTFIVQPTLAKLDSNFQIEWVRHFGRIKSVISQVIFRDIEPTLDGNFIGAGESAIDSPVGSAFASGWLMKFSPEGDSLWSRYDLAPFPPNNGNDHFFGGVGLLSSGNIIAGGTAVENNKHYIWLVKVTPDGCLDTLFCQPISTLGEMSAKADISIYPNPADETLTIESAIGFQDGYALLIDLQGKIVLKQALPNSSGQMSLSTANLVPGMYFLKIQTPKGILIHSKILIAH